MKEIEAADRYAGSVFAIASEREQEEVLLRELTSIKEMAAKDPRILKLLQNPMLDRQEKDSLIKNLGGSILTQRFLMLLTLKKRIDLFKVVVERFKALVHQKKNVADVTVISARALDVQAAQGLKGALQKKIRMNILLTLKIDARLIGGLQVRIGNHLMDGSIRTRLDQLESRLRSVKV